MNTNSAEGSVKQLAGEVKETVGAVLDDPVMQISGKAKALCGQSQQLVKDAAAVAREAIAEKPLVVLGAAVAIGFAVGALWSRRSAEVE